MIKDEKALRYEINPREFARLPLNWVKIFQREAPLGVEVGCGNGEFLTAWATEQPQWNLVGMELSLASTERSQQRIFRQQLNNVRLIREDAVFGIRELFPDRSMRILIMNFPDPWPKERHRRRRLISTDFAGTLGAVLELQGSFELYTDQLWYAEDARDIFHKSRYFECSDIRENPFRHVSTKYERKWKLENRQIWYFNAVKIKDNRIKRTGVSAVMPHVYIKSKISSEDILPLQGLEIREKDSMVKVKEIFRSVRQDAFLVRTVAVDKDYMQTFFILIAPHNSDFIVKIDSGFQPYRTPAVKMAVEKIAQNIRK
jgi:tRNA (guanine-N7-)-methyltransferase